MAERFVYWTADGKRHWSPYLGITMDLSEFEKNGPVDRRGSRSILEVVAIKGQIYLFDRPRPQKYERIDHDGLAEAGYGPDDFE
jgi:hypothetical protein